MFIHRLHKWCILCHVLVTRRLMVYAVFRHVGTGQLWCILPILQLIVIKKNPNDTNDYNIFSTYATSSLTVFLNIKMYSRFRHLIRLEVTKWCTGGRIIVNTTRCHICYFYILSRHIAYAWPTKMGYSTLPRALTCWIKISELQFIKTNQNDCDISVFLHVSKIVMY